MSCTDHWPFDSQVEPGWNQILNVVVRSVGADNQVELVDYNIPQNQQSITIPFTVTKLSANYLPFGATIYNKVDSSVLTGVTLTPTTFSTTSMTGLLSATFSTGNYYYKAIIAVVGS